jgi:hypothetical protein
LVISGGSDFHGGAAGNGLGSVAVPWAAWEGLKRRHHLVQASYQAGQAVRGRTTRMMFFMGADHKCKDKAPSTRFVPAGPCIMVAGLAPPDYLGWQKYFTPS